MTDLTRLTLRIQELESRQARSDREIANLRDLLKNSDSGEAADVLCRRVEWVIPDISQKLRELPKGHSLYSSDFSAAGIRGLQLEFFPNGRESATIDGMCSVFFRCSENTRVRYQLFVGSHYRAPDDDDFQQRMGHGHSNFCRLEPEVDSASDSVTIGIEILEVSKTYNVGPGLKVIRSPFPALLARELAVIDNKAVTRVEWRVTDFSRKLKTAVRGASLYSPLFSAAGVRELQMEFYPRGNQSTNKEGNCAYYLRCPEGTRLVVTLIVGEFKRGPITANFEGPAGKGIPDFCDVMDQIDNSTDSLLIALELKNASEGLVEGRKTLLTL